MVHHSQRTCHGRCYGDQVGTRAHRRRDQQSGELSQSISQPIYIKLVTINYCRLLRCRKQQNIIYTIKNKKKKTDRYKLIHNIKTQNYNTKTEQYHVNIEFNQNYKSYKS